MREPVYTPDAYAVEPARQSNGHRPFVSVFVPAPAPPAGANIDFEAVRLLRGRVGEALAGWMRGERDHTAAEVDRERRRIAGELVAQYADTARRGGLPLTADDQQALLGAVLADLVGLGRLQNLLTDDSVEEVHVLGYDRVRITRRDGTIDLGAPIADSDAEVVEILQTLARRAGATERALSTANPILDLQLPGGERLAATYQISHRPYAVIRRHNTLDVTLSDLAGERADLDEMLDGLMRDFLAAAVAARLNIMVAGCAGAGKTTVLRALARQIPADEPWVLLEESRELGLHRSDHHPWLMSFESRDGHGERGLDGRPVGEMTIAGMFPITLRLGAQRIVVGEVRGREIVAMLEAMTASSGSMCTVHARSPHAVPGRIIQLALTYGKEMTPARALATAAEGLDLIVYVTLLDETGIGGRKHRYVSHVDEVIHAQDGRLVRTELFGPGPDGRGVPRHLPERVRESLRLVGYDPRVLSAWIEAGHGAWRRRTDSLSGRSTP